MKLWEVLWTIETKCESLYNFLFRKDFIEVGDLVHWENGWETPSIWYIMKVSYKDNILVYKRLRDINVIEIPLNEEIEILRSRTKKYAKLYKCLSSLDVKIIKRNKQNNGIRI